jgi:hypothetical protein
MAVAITARENGNNSGSLSGSTYTFSNVSIGTAASDRIVVICVSVQANATISTVTIGGINASLGKEEIYTAATPDVVASIWYAFVPTGTTATVAVTLSAGSDASITISTYEVTGASAVLSDTDGNNGAAGSISITALTIPTGGGAIFCFTNDTRTTAVAWTNATEHADANIATGSLLRHSTAHTTTAAVNPTITADGATAGQALAGIAFAATTDATASATGTGTAEATATATTAAAGAASGTGTAEATATTVVAATGEASGAGTATAAYATGSRVIVSWVEFQAEEGVSDQGVGTATGTGTADAVGAQTAAATGAATGTGTADAVGEQIAAADGAASGTGTATADGTSFSAGVGEASGTGTATAVGTSFSAGVGEASGTGTATAVGTSSSDAVGEASGAGEATAVGTSTAEAVGEASGTGTASGDGVAAGAVSAVGEASGTSSAVGTSTLIYGNTEIICVHAEPRAMSVEAENRAMIVPCEDRAMIVLEERHSMLAEPRKRAC